jgi:pimeloyl-ACP methyl ester carboxylesterase
MAKGQKIYERQGKSIYFKNEDFDFNLQWMLGCHSYGGLSIGEGFYIASRIKSGNVKDWEREFINYGTLQENNAKNLIKENNYIAAGKRYMCAFNAYRAAVMFMRPSRTDFYDVITKFEDAFQLAMKYKHIQINSIEVPFENSTLPGYFYKSTNADSNTPLIIIIGGSDSFREDLYFFGGAEAINRNYNVLMIDLPGQGKVPARGMPFRHDMEKPIMEAIDWLTYEKYIFTNKIGIYGVSGGGYFAMRPAAYDKRIKALALSTPIYDVYSVISDTIPKFLITLSKFRGLIRLFFNSADVGIEKYFWQAGVKSYEEAIDKVKKWTVDIDLIDCPVFAVTGISEGKELKRQTKIFYDKLKIKYNQSYYKEYQVSDGADSHCQINNFPLAHQELFDWFDLVL